MLKDVPETFAAVAGFVSLLKGKKRPKGITLSLQLEQILPKLYQCYQDSQLSCKTNDLFKLLMASFSLAVSLSCSNTP